jgi:hypothetical protein
MEKVETEESSLECEDLCFENSNHEPQVFVSQIHIYLYTFGYRFGPPIDLMRTTKS